MLMLNYLCSSIVISFMWFSVEMNVKVSGMFVKFEVMLEKVSNGFLI